MVCFTIPDEAMPLIMKYMDKKTGKLVFGKYRTYVSCYNTLTRKMKNLALEVGIRHDFTLYSDKEKFCPARLRLGNPLEHIGVLHRAKHEGRPPDIQLCVYNESTRGQSYQDDFGQSEINMIKGRIISLKVCT